MNIVGITALPWQLKSTLRLSGFPAFRLSVFQTPALYSFPFSFLFFNFVFFFYQIFKFIPPEIRFIYKEIMNLFFFKEFFINKNNNQIVSAPLYNCDCDCVCFNLINWWQFIVPFSDILEQTLLSNEYNSVWPTYQQNSSINFDFFAINVQRKLRFLSIR